MEVRKQIPVHENMWKEEDGIIHLIGCICEDCGEVFFPIKEASYCSNCQSNSLKEIELSQEGKIYSYTVAHQMPAGGYYKGTVPFVYGLVELPEGVLVQSHIICDDYNSISIGDKVKIVLDTLFVDDEYETITYKFKHFSSMEVTE